MNYRTARLVLGTRAASTYTEIKQAFRRKAIQTHPDRNRDRHAVRDFATLTLAYKFLMEYRSPFQITRYLRKSDRGRGSRSKCLALVKLDG